MSLISFHTDWDPHGDHYTRISEYLDRPDWWDEGYRAIDDFFDHEVEQGEAQDQQLEDLLAAFDKEKISDESGEPAPSSEKAEDVADNGGSANALPVGFFLSSFAPPSSKHPIQQGGVETDTLSPAGPYAAALDRATPTQDSIPPTPVRNFPPFASTPSAEHLTHHKLASQSALVKGAGNVLTSAFTLHVIDSPGAALQEKAVFDATTGDANDFADQVSVISDESDEGAAGQVETAIRPQHDHASTSIPVESSQTSNQGLSSNTFEVKKERNVNDENILFSQAPVFPVSDIISAHARSLELATQSSASTYPAVTIEESQNQPEEPHSLNEAGDDVDVTLDSSLTSLVTASSPSAAVDHQGSPQTPSILVEHQEDSDLPVESDLPSAVSRGPASEPLSPHAPNWEQLLNRETASPPPSSPVSTKGDYESPIAALSAVASKYIDVNVALSSPLVSPFKLWTRKPEAQYRPSFQGHVSQNGNGSSYDKVHQALLSAQRPLTDQGPEPSHEPCVPEWVASGAFYTPSTAYTPFVESREEKRKQYFTPHPDEPPYKKRCTVWGEIPTKFVEETAVQEVEERMTGEASKNLVVGKANENNCRKRKLTSFFWSKGGKEPPAATSPFATISTSSAEPADIVQPVTYNFHSAVPVAPVAPSKGKAKAPVASPTASPAKKKQKFADPTSPDELAISPPKTTVATPKAERQPRKFSLAIKAKTTPVKPRATKSVAVSTAKKVTAKTAPIVVNRAIEDTAMETIKSATTEQGSTTKVLIPTKETQAPPKQPLPKAKAGRKRVGTKELAGLFNSPPRRAAEKNFVEVGGRLRSESVVSGRATSVASGRAESVIPAGLVSRAGSVVRASSVNTGVEAVATTEQITDTTAIEPNPFLNTNNKGKGTEFSNTSDPSSALHDITPVQPTIEPSKDELRPPLKPKRQREKGSHPISNTELEALGGTAISSTRKTRSTPAGKTRLGFSLKNKTTGGRKR